MATPDDAAAQLAGFAADLDNAGLPEQVTRILGDQVTQALTLYRDHAGSAQTGRFSSSREFSGAGFHVTLVLGRRKGLAGLFRKLLG